MLRGRFLGAWFDNGRPFRLSLRYSTETASVVASMAQAWGINDPTLRRILKAQMALRTASLEGDAAAVRTARLQAKDAMGLRSIESGRSRTCSAMARPRHLAERDLRP